MRKGSLNKKESKEKDTTSSNLNEVMNRRILHEELEARDYVTKSYLHEELEARDYVTKNYLSEELERRDYTTKSYLHEELSSLEVRFDVKMDARILEQRKEYERYAGAWAENLQSQMSALAEMIACMAEDLTSIKEWIKEDHYAVHKHIDFRLNALEASAGATS